MSQLESLQGFDAFFEEVHRKVIADVIQPARDAKVLDVGSGAGGMSALLAAAVSAGVVVALDPNGEHLRRTRDRAEESGFGSRLVCVPGDVEKLQFLAGEFDVIWCSRVIHHHLPDPKLALSEMYRVLKPGGRLFLREVSSEPPTADSDIWRRLAVANDRWFQSKFRHRRPATAEWMELLRLAGFADQKMQEIAYVPVDTRRQVVYLRQWVQRIIEDDRSPEFGNILSPVDRLAAGDLLRYFDETSNDLQLQVDVPTSICIGTK